MTTHLEIDTTSTDNDKSLFKSKRVKLNGKQAETPIRVLDPSKFRSNVRLNQDALGMNELYREFDAKKISALQKDASALDSVSREMTNLLRRGRQGDLAVCMVKYSVKDAFPSESEIEFLTDVAHSYSDMTPIPMLNTSIDSKNFQAFLGYVQKSYGAIQELNHKPIMGVLPSIPRESYPALLDFYLDHDINAFYFDFDGRTPNPLLMRPVLKHLQKKKVFEKTLIYGVNAKPGRTLKNSNVLPAKDFIAYGYGIDILGESHIGMRAPRFFFEKLKRAVNQQQQNKKRVFIKSDYGYYKTNTASDVRAVYPSDTGIKIADIFSDEQKTWQKLFNMEQQAIEAKAIKTRLNDLDAGESVLDYIKGKVQVQKELGALQSASRLLSKSKS